MRTVAQHLKTCLETVGPVPALDVLLPDTVGCILAEDVAAPFDLPVSDVAAYDGYAVNSADIAQANTNDPARLNVIDEVLPGQAKSCVVITGSAIIISSGVAIPSGADCVVPLDATDHGQTKVTVTKAFPARCGIRPRAQDVSAGTVVLSKGTRVGARQVSLLAGVGRSRVKVHPRPRVVVVSIGDELVEPGHEARSGTVFDANGHALTTAVSDAGAQAYRVAAVPDERNTLRESIEDQLVRADLIITTGGLSYGAGDTLKEVLSPLGTVRFDNVAMWPGRQMGIGTVTDVLAGQVDLYNNNEATPDGACVPNQGGHPKGIAPGTPIFCLPGDPVAAQVAFEVFVRPALRAMAGWSDLFRPSLEASVDTSWQSPAGRREFVRVRLSGDPTRGYKAKIQGDPQALLLSSLSRSNALAVVPESTTEVKVGDKLLCLLLD